MPVYNKNDFIYATNNAISVLEQDYNDADDLITAINEFNSQSVSYLKGKNWDTMRDVLGIYVSVLQKRKEVSNEVKEKIVMTNSKIVEILEPLDIVNTDSLERLELAYNRTIDLITTNLENGLTSEEDLENRETLAKIRASINQIENVERAADESLNIIKALENTIVTYDTTVNNIVPTKIEAPI